MKLIISCFLLFVAIDANSSYGQELGFFSLVNAIPSEDATILKVENRVIGDGYRTGFFTGGMGFPVGTVNVSISNPIAKKEASISVTLNVETSPILVAYLEWKEEVKEDGEIELKAEIKFTKVESVAEDQNEISLLYVGNAEEINFSLHKKTQISLKRGRVENLGAQQMPLIFYQKDEMVSGFESEDLAPWLLVFFHDLEGNLKRIPCVMFDYN